MGTDENTDGHRSRGAALILVVSLMVLCSLAAVVAFSLLAQGTTAGLGLGESVEAQGIAVGGKEWYLQELTGIDNWNSESGKAYNDIALGAGSFDVEVLSASANSVSFKVSAGTPGYLNQTVQRQLALTAKKLPKACGFAVFRQEDGPEARLVLSTTNPDTHIFGNVWSRGSVRANSACTVTDGLVYYAAGKVVDGSGTYTSFEVQQPYPAMPEIDVSAYEILMNAYDVAIDNNTSSDSTSVSNETITLNGNTLEYYDFQTQDDVTITGHGRIVAKNDVLLHNTGGRRTQTLTITPQGGTIEFLAGNNLRINNGGRRQVNINPGTIMYARSRDGTDRLLQITQRNSTYYTSIDDALLLARRCLIVDNGAIISNSTLYVDYADSNSNNQLRITDGSQVSGTIISRGRAHPSLRINNGSSVSGFVYQYGSSSRGRTEINGNSVVTGAVLVRQFQSDSLGPANITYNLQSVLDNAPQFDGNYVMVEPYSWDDH